MSETLSNETLIAKIEQGIASLDEVKTLRLERDAVLQGRTDRHPVDLYWEFTDGDLIYKTVIQVRSWESTASNADLFRFVSLLRDISGQTAGVLFSQPVYDKDAQQLARNAGVLLYELSKEAAAPRLEAMVRQPALEVDTAWTEAEKRRLGLEHETFQFASDPKYMFLYDEAGNCIDSINGIINACLKRKQDASAERVAVHHFFEQPTFLQIDDERIPRVKLNGLRFDVEYLDPHASMGEEIAQAILSHVLGYYSR